MARFVRLINNTVSDIDLSDDLNIDKVPGSGSKEVSETYTWHLQEAWRNGVQLKPAVDSGDLSVEVDGVVLDKFEADRFFQIYRLIIKNPSAVQVAREVKEIQFLGSAVDSVVEDPADSGVVKATINAGQVQGKVVEVEFTNTGSSGNKWMHLISEDHQSNRIQWVWPFGVKLIAINYGNEKNNTRFRLDIHRALAGSGSSDSRIFRWTQGSNCRVATKRTGANTDVTNLTDVTFAIGDKMAVFLRKNGGTEPDTPYVKLWFQVTDDSLTDTLENYSGNF